MKLYFTGSRHNCSGETIRRLREKQRLSQEALAAKLQLAGLNLNQKAISRIETGNRIVADFELFYFSEVLNVPVTCLLEGFHNQKAE